MVLSDGLTPNENTKYHEFVKELNKDHSDPYHSYELFRSFYSEFWVFNNNIIYLKLLRALHIILTFMTLMMIIYGKQNYLSAQYIYFIQPKWQKRLKSLFLNLIISPPQLILILNFSMKMVISISNYAIRYNKVLFFVFKFSVMVFKQAFLSSGNWEFQMALFMHHK